MIPAAPTPDALLIPARYKRGATQAERVASINRIAYPLLGVDTGKGEDAWMRDGGPRGNILVTKDPADTLYGPLNSPFRGRPRYDWIDRPDGIRLGYLRDEFRAVEFEPFDPIAAGVCRYGH